MLLLLISGGLFLGWSLGANDAANVFGTAVGTKMIRFKKAALICSVFVIIGAVVQGSGASHTLNSLGSVNNLNQAFILTLSSALIVYANSMFGLPVSTSQAIVGAIIGWNLFAGLTTDYYVLRKIVSTWVLCPLLSAAFAIPMYFAMKKWFSKSKIHLLKQDSILRYGLIIIGAFGSYSLGANNIANVMGVYAGVVNFNDINILGITITGLQQLFFIGALSISVGVYTFSQRTMKTVGGKLFKLTPESAIIIVMAHSLVLFVFSSSTLSTFISSIGLPPIPLVPVSSSQAIIGAIIGIGLAKGGYGINYKVLGEVALGWITTPIFAAILSYILLYLFSNIF